MSEPEWWWASIDGEPIEPVRAIRREDLTLIGVWIFGDSQVWEPEGVRLIARLHAPPPDLTPATGDPV